eukprot:SAG22_NODE_155_length_17123_cov_37.528489_13_plen_145_part_00
MMKTVYRSRCRDGRPEMPGCVACQAVWFGGSESSAGFSAGAMQQADTGWAAVRCSQPSAPSAPATPHSTASTAHHSTPQHSAKQRDTSGYSLSRASQRAVGLTEDVAMQHTPAPLPLRTERPHGEDRKTTRKGTALARKTVGAQ